MAHSTWFFSHYLSARRCRSCIGVITSMQLRGGTAMASEVLATAVFMVHQSQSSCSKICLRSNTLDSKEIISNSKAFRIQSTSFLSKLAYPGHLFTGNCWFVFCWCDRVSHNSHLSASAMLALSPTGSHAETSSNWNELGSHRVVRVFNTRVKVISSSFNSAMIFGVKWSLRTISVNTVSSWIFSP